MIRADLRPAAGRLGRGRDGGAGADSLDTSAFAAGTIGVSFVD
jgi:hypothetical protein